MTVPSGPPKWPDRVAMVESGSVAAEGTFQTVDLLQFQDWGPAGVRGGGSGDSGGFFCDE